MRALLIVLDSVGVGEAPDAADYGDAGSHTLGHILDACPDLQLPTLQAMGLGRVLGCAQLRPLVASYGRMREVSAGKDSTTGHWELAGVVLNEPFSIYSAFPDDLIQAIEREAQVRFIGNRPASGTAIINELGAEHCSSGELILYTSADSVMQIAAHEAVLPPAELYRVCAAARRHADAFRVGRVIARPFAGSAGQYQRTAGRRDFSMPPPPNVLDALTARGWPVHAVGKTAELFAHRGVTHIVTTQSNGEGMQAIDATWSGARGLVFANLVDFDTLFGHRRDVAGYANALREFDQWLGGFLQKCNSDDLVIVTADHGNDPTFAGTDHTREEVPLLVRGPVARGDLGCRQSFCDVAATLADYFEIDPWSTGQSFLDG